jgi:hypothetical protein
MGQSKLPQTLELRRTLGLAFQNQHERRRGVDLKAKARGELRRVHV